MCKKENYKDLDKWRETKNRQRKRYYNKTKNAENCRKRWLDEEIDMVMAHTIPDAELSVLIGRSVGAIQARRCHEKNKRANQENN